jgi:4-aminobutyrate aminotransferase-like enzyme
VLDFVARDAKAFFHQEGSSPCIGTLTASDGAWLIDDRGHRLLDLHGNTKCPFREIQSLYGAIFPSKMYVVA